MKNKLLICGSAVAVIVLVLASLSPVVGFHAVKSSVKNSPLFGIRTSRAIDAEQDSLTCDYVGKDKGNTISIPTLNSRDTSFQNFIDSISMMDDKEFNRFIGLLINHVHQNKIKNEDVDEIITSLHMLRANPEEAKKYATDLGITFLTRYVVCTIGSDHWQPGCIMWFILLLPLIILFIINEMASVFWGETICLPTSCGPYSYCICNVMFYR